MKRQFWTLRYTLINVFYFAAFCTIHGFATVFLLDKGFSNTLVGITLALSNILSVIGQPVVAAIVDRSPKITNRKVLIGVAVVMLLCSLLLSFVKSNIPVIFIFYVINFTVQFIGMSNLIAISFEYEAKGCRHNFGLARGLGSASFAVTSAIMGPIIARKTPVVDMYVTVAFMALMAMVVFFFRLPDDGVNVSLEKKEFPKGEEPSNNIFEFIRRYPFFVLFALATALCFFSHNMLNDYLIQIIRNLGGDEAHLGYASFLQAILELPVMALIVYVFRRINVRWVIIVSAVAFFVKVVVMYFATSLGGMYASQSFQLFAYAVFIPAAAYFSDEVMREGDKVKGQAYINSATTLGGVFSNLVCGRVLDKRGVSPMILLGVLVCAVGVAVMAIAMMQSKRVNVHGREE